MSNRKFPEPPPPPEEPPCPPKLRNLKHYNNNISNNNMLSMFFHSEKAALRSRVIDHNIMANGLRSLVTRQLSVSPSSDAK